MPSIVFDNIIGLDKKSSETDIDPRFATKLQNLSTTKKPGALEKDGAYSDVSDSLTGSDLPSGLTRKSLFEWGITNPANTDIYLCHAQDSNSKNRIYIGQAAGDSDLSQVPASGWHEMTEHEGPYTLIAADITAGTNANKLVVDDDNTDFDDLSTTADYYNGWYLVVAIAAGQTTEVMVTDYTVTATTKTFDVKDGSLTNIAASDSFTLSRTRAMSEGIGESSSGAPPRYGTFTVDDVVRWIARENAAIGMCGNQSQFPSQFVWWYGYIDRKYGRSDTGDNESLQDFVLDVEQLIKPYVESAGSDDLTTGPGAGSEIGILDTQSAGAAGSLTTGTWTIYLAYEYDDLQIGPISEGQTISVSSSNSIDGAVRIPYKGCYDATSVSANLVNYDSYIRAYITDDVSGYISPYLISRRVTAVRVYAKIPGTTTRNFLQRLIISYSDDVVSGLGGPISSPTIGDDYYMVLSADGVIKINFAITADSEVEDNNTYEQDVGQTNIQPNFKYGASISTHFIAGAIRTRSGDRKNNNLIASLVDGLGIAVPDNFGAANVINLGFYGSKKITGISVLGDTGIDQSPKARAVVFTDDDYYVLSITAGSSFSFELDNIGQKEGLFAQNSLVFAEGLLLGVSRNGFRIFTTNGTNIIGEGFKDDFDALTDPSEGVGVYIKKDRVVVWHFPTDNKTFVVDLLSDKYSMFEYSWADTFTWFAQQRSGNALALSSSAIYQINSGSDQDGTAITPLVRTKRMTAMDGFGKPTGDHLFFTKGWIKYQSDTAITLNFYLDNSATALTFNNLSLPAQTTEAEVEFKFPKGTVCKEAEAEVTLSASQASSNTDFRFNSLRLDAYTKRRR